MGGTPTDKEIFNKAETDDRVVFSNIIARYPDSTERRINDLAFRIVHYNGEGYSKKEMKQFETRDKLHDNLNNKLVGDSLKEKKYYSYLAKPDRMKKLLQGKWYITPLSSEMAICGIPPAVCSFLPICCETKFISFRKNGFFNTGTNQYYQPYEFNTTLKDSFGYQLILVKDTFSILFSEKNLATLFWENREPDESLYYYGFTLAFSKQKPKLHLISLNIK